MIAKFAPQNFIPDGDLQKSVWQTAASINFDHDVYAANSYPDHRTEVAALWTDNSVYFSFRCKYSILNIYDGEDPWIERWQLWERDVVEVFVNPQPERMNHYYEFEVSPNNQWIDLEIDKTRDPFCDAAWDSRFTHATRVEAKSRLWNCEMRIPLESLCVDKILPGSEWRINFFRADGQGNNSQRRLTSWCTVPGGTTFHTPSRFGLIQFLQ